MQKRFWTKRPGRELRHKPGYNTNKYHNTINDKREKRKYHKAAAGLDTGCLHEKIICLCTFYNASCILLFEYEAEQAFTLLTGIVRHIKHWNDFIC
jgi:hypothetical protein